MSSTNISKTIVAQPNTEKLIHAFGIGKVTTVPGLNILPDAETVIHMKEQQFVRPKRYDGQTVAQRCIIVADRAGRLLVTESSGRPGKSIITVGKGSLRPDELLTQKLPHITPVDSCGHGDFGVLIPCETDKESGMLFLGRILLAGEVGIFQEDTDSHTMPRTLSWETPQSLYEGKALSNLQLSILLWMKHRFG